MNDNQTPLTDAVCNRVSQLADNLPTCITIAELREWLVTVLELHASNGRTLEKQLAEVKKFPIYFILEDDHKLLMARSFEDLGVWLYYDGRNVLSHFGVSAIKLAKQLKLKEISVEQAHEILERNPDHQITVDEAWRHDLMAKNGKLTAVVKKLSDALQSFLGDGDIEQEIKLAREALSLANKLE